MMVGLGTVDLGDSLEMAEDLLEHHNQCVERVKVSTSSVVHETSILHTDIRTYITRTQYTNILSNLTHFWLINALHSRRSCKKRWRGWWRHVMISYKMNIMMCPVLPGQHRQCTHYTNESSQR